MTASHSSATEPPCTQVHKTNAVLYPGWQGVRELDRDVEGISHQTSLLQCASGGSPAILAC